MTEDLATPRPWFWDSYSRIYGGPPVVSGDGDREYTQVVPLPNPTRGDVTTRRGGADAALIVDAVNAYDRLQAVAAAARTLRVETFGRAQNDEDIKAAWDTLREALDAVIA